MKNERVVRKKVSKLKKRSGQIEKMKKPMRRFEKKKIKKKNYIYLYIYMQIVSRKGFVVLVKHRTHNVFLAVYVDFLFFLCISSVFLLLQFPVMFLPLLLLVVFAMF